MPKIIDKLNAEACSGLGPFFSYEFFPPKTEAGVENLYLRMERMTAINPVFVDITWGAGGSTRDLTLDISHHAQTYLGTDVLMHLTCTGLSVEEIKAVLQQARDRGIQNILALRGDAPKGALSWEPQVDGLRHAVDLVRLIREEHGDYFGIAVAGFPEGHPASFPARSTGSPPSASAPAAPDLQAEQPALERDIALLKEKLEAGADFVLTQFFYDPEVFIDYTRRCRAAGIACPIVPGMMPIQSHSQFQKMVSFCRTRVPDKIWQDLAAIKEDDEAVKVRNWAIFFLPWKHLAHAATRHTHIHTHTHTSIHIHTPRPTGLRCAVLRRHVPAAVCRGRARIPLLHAQPRAQRAVGAGRAGGEGAHRGEEGAAVARVSAGGHVVERKPVLPRCGGRRQQ